MFGGSEGNRGVFVSGAACLIYPAAFWRARANYGQQLSEITLKSSCASGIMQLFRLLEAHTDRIKPEVMG